MRKLFWLIIVGVVIFLIVYGIVPEVKAPVDAIALSIGGQVAVALVDFWGGVMATPAYQQFHMIFWFIGGIVFFYALTRLWTRRPTLLKTTKKQQTVYEEPRDVIITETPSATRQTIPPSSPTEKEEATVNVEK